MFLVLLALQAETTQNVNLNVNPCKICGFVSMLKGDPKARNRKAVGKMLANGDCAGAEKYALEKGDFDLADRVRERCSAGAPASPIAH